MTRSRGSTARPLTPASRRPRWRDRAATLIAVPAAFLAAALTYVAPAQASTPHAAADDTTATIGSGALSIQVDRTFPQVRGYALGGATLPGQERQLSQVLINGTAYTPAVTSTVAADAVSYKLRIDQIDATIDATIAVRGDVMTFRVDGIDEAGDTSVDSFAIPDQMLMAARADQPGAELSTMLLRKTYYDYKGNQDKHLAVADAAVDAQPQPANVAIVNTNALAAAITTNAITTYGPLRYQTTETAGVKRTGVWSNTWTVRGPDGVRLPLPAASVVVTGEANGDGAVDWQDGATALRTIMPKPKGAEKVKDSVVQYISMNFMSGAQKPFIRALDDIKKGYLYTDGLGQAVQFKGFAGEGHDAAHEDYAGHYNVRAGGLKDLKYAVDQAHKFNARVGVHIQQEGQLLESHMFRWDNMPAGGPYDPCYFYGDGHFCIDGEKDLASGAHLKRIQALKKDVPDLDFIYDDAFFGEDWRAYRLAKNISDQGWELYTEFPSYLWPYVTWFHQSAEYDNVGVESDMMRFLYNSYADVWPKVDNPLLGGVGNKGIGGWHGEHDVNAWIHQVFTRNLPTKYLQHFDITKITRDAEGKPSRVDLSGGVSSSYADGGKVRITRNGAVIADGETSLVPWPPADPKKAYHWNAAGGATTWTVPAGWTKATLYKLTDTGRQRVADLPVTGRTVTINAAKNTPYVLYPAAVAPQADVKFGNGTIVKDGQFSARTFTDWDRSGSGISIGTDDRGWPVLQLTGNKDNQVSQRLAGLAPGDYTASAWVSTDQGRPATVAVSGTGRPEVANTITAPPPVDSDYDHHLQGMPFQPLKVNFTVPAGRTGATLNLRSGGGAGTASFVDVRVVKTAGPASGHFYAQDFEHVDYGWGPFVLAQESEPGIHLSERNENYTRDTINGDWSLKSVNGQQGLVYRTWPGSLRLQPNRVYRARLSYQADGTTPYSFQVRADGRDAPIASSALVQTTGRRFDSAPPAGGAAASGWTDALPPQDSAPHTTWEQTFATGCGDAYLALSQDAGGNSGAVIDDVVVDDLGPASDTCTPLGTVDVGSPLVAPGKTVTVPVTYTNRGSRPQRNVKVTLAAAAGLTVKAAGPVEFAEVAPGAGVTVPVEVTAPASKPAESLWLTARATGTWNGKEMGVTGSGAVLLGYSSLAAAFDRVSTTDNADTKVGDFDGAGNSFSREALAAAGATPGGKVGVDGADLTWPDAAAGTPDSVTANGQTIVTSGSGGVIAFLGAGGTGDRGTVTVRYTDGSSSTSQVAVPDWDAADPRGFGARPVIRALGNNGPSGPQHPDATFNVYYNTAPIEQGKQVASVTLPDNQMRIFAMAVKPARATPVAGDNHVSDLVWAQATGGWGPPERDHSNGEDLAGDGNAIRIGGQVFDKGFGAAPFGDAPSVVGLDLAGKCSRFTATVGQDDEQPTRGSVVFKVVIDGATVYTSPVLRPDSANESVDVSVAGGKRVELLTDPAGDGNGNDHGSWGDAKFTCG